MAQENPSLSAIVRPGGLPANFVTRRSGSSRWKDITPIEAPIWQVVVKTRPGNKKAKIIERRNPQNIYLDPGSGALDVASCSG